MKSRLLEEKNIHFAFEVSLLLKGAFAVAEVLTGIGVYLVTQQFIFRLVEVARRSARLDRQLPSPVGPALFGEHAQLHRVLPFEPRRHQALVDRWPAANQAGVLPDRHRRLRALYPLPAVQLQPHAFGMVALDHGRGHRRDRPDVARVRPLEALARPPDVKMTPGRPIPNQGDTPYEARRYRCCDPVRADDSRSPASV